MQGLRAVGLGRSVAVCEQPLTRLWSGRGVGGPSRCVLPAAEAGPGAGGAETAGATWRSAAGAWPGRHVNLVPPLGQGLSSGGLAMAGLDFWGEGPLVGAKFPSWCRSRLVGRRKGVGCALFCYDATRPISSSGCVQPFPPVCVCSRPNSWSSSLEAFLSPN